MDFSADLEKAISNLIPSQDPLDMPDFDAVDYINRLFPDAASLSKLDAVSGKLRVLMARTDDEVLRQVRRQSLASAKGKRELQLAGSAIEALFKQISEIKSKAEKSERMVEEVCRDIKSLDYAKKNLTASITTLKRLQMLVTGVAQLKAMSGRRQYKEVASLLQATSALQGCFDEFAHLQRVSEARQQLAALREECANLVYSEFEALDHHGPTPPYFADLCAVIEALGRGPRLQFMSWFVKDRLMDYETTFKENEERSRLENINMRFNWLRRELQFYAQHFENTFPASWEMPQLLCEEFCLVTKEKLAKILSETKNSLSVQSLVDTMKCTIAFEADLNAKFAGDSRSVAAGAKPVPVQVDVAQEQDNALAEQLARSNPLSPEALKLKWKKFQEEKRNTDALQQQAIGGKTLAPCTRFTRIISDVYESYLEIYVHHEEKDLQQTMSKWLKGQTVDEFEERNMVFESSQTLFGCFKDVMTTCTSLSKGAAFFSISEMFRASLRQYCDYLGNKLPSSGKVLNTGDEKVICFVINTAEYCTSNVEALQATVRSHIEASFAERVDLAAEQERFQTVVARGMQALVKALESRLAPAMTKMQKLNWGSWEAVVVESEYVQMIEVQVRDCSSIYHKWLSKSRFGFFCDSFANSFISKLRDAVFSSKSVCEVGAEQLLLDMAHIKVVLEGLPKQGAADRVPQRHKKIVQKEMEKLDRILKVLLTPREGVVDSYVTLVGVKGTAAELQRLLELKGMRATGPLLEKYLEKVQGLKKPQEEKEKEKK